VLVDSPERYIAAAMSDLRLVVMLGFDYEIVIHPAKKKNATHFA
jgi:hypothetical protein